MTECSRSPTPFRRSNAWRQRPAAGGGEAGHGVAAGGGGAVGVKGGGGAAAGAAADPTGLRAAETVCRGTLRFFGGAGGATGCNCASSGFGETVAEPNILSAGRTLTGTVCG